MGGVVEKKRNWGKIGCLALVGFVLLIGIIAALAPDPTPEQLAARQAEEEAKEAEEAAERLAEARQKIDSATVVTARDLAAAYEANEVAAQQQFGDRLLLVTGQVTGITLDLFDEPVVQMAGVNQFLSVQADLNDKNVAAALQKGQEISLLCEKVTEVISIPMLDECELVDPES